MQLHENVREQVARQRRDEAERIAIRMGFHSAFVRATAAEAAAVEHARARAVAAQRPGPVVRTVRQLRRRMSTA
jgi:hypothetical protein